MNDLSHAKQPPTPVCGNCVHIGFGPNTQNDVMMRCCWRYPPQPLAVMTQKGVAIVSARGEVRPDTPACGEFDDGLEKKHES